MELFFFHSQVVSQFEPQIVGLSIRFIHLRFVLLFVSGRTGRQKSEAPCILRVLYQSTTRTPTIVI